MNNSGSFYEQIEDYLAGRLTSDQQAVLQQALRDDPELAREVELRRLEFEVSETLIAGSIRDQLQRLRTEPPPDAPDAPPPRNPGLVRWFLAALLCIVAIGIYWWMAREPVAPTPEITPPPPGQTPVISPNPEPVPQAHNQPSPGTGRPTEGRDAPARQYLALAAELYQRPDFESLRSATTAANDPLKTALSAWQKQDYPGVLTALQHIHAENPNYWRAATLHAHAQFNLKQFRPAAQEFTAIADGKIQPWAEEADGYLLLALLADGQAETPGFRARLQKVLADPGHPGFDLAKAIQQGLKPG